MICIASSNPTHQSSHRLTTVHKLKCPPSSLETTIRSHTDQSEEDAIEIFESDDASMLYCRANPGDETIFGFSNDGDISVTKLEPTDESEDEGCCCVHPRGEWERRKLNALSDDTGSARCTERELTIVNLTKIQNERLNDINAYPSFDTPAKVFHLLRSTLTCPSGLHCASPWYGPTNCWDKAIALLVNIPSFSDNDSSNNEFWDELEEREVEELINFRTGDASPSYYLHSTTRLMGGSFSESSNEDPLAQLFKNERQCDTMLLVYRHLPPRDVLTVDRPTDCTPEDENTISTPGCLWEKYIEIQNSSSEEDEEAPKNTIKHRLISPPYLSHHHEYPTLLNPILKNLQTIREEALNIPKWTAWPERNHYSSNNDDNQGGAQWTVFPLCHTFPAHDVSKRKFIQNTCSFVPKTTALLKNLGKLRTALFSRLEKRTALGSHTGWSDLANYVLRVHVPLVVGEGCGTWVDGCVETHDEGRIIVFDDSKNHRAYNYGEEERIVLILDLERPDSLPRGTATGDHTEELDEFIQQLT